ncbi:MAG: serine/threonine-protein kinase [Myxococcota bacterium]|nr:serine/threonine-protein kinase [Myxococcota bacterium]
MRCLDANEVVRVLEGEPPAGFEDHVDSCGDCRALMVELARSFDVEETTIGRYVVLEPIGAGAMGIVYRAYDPELDRDVALKLVRAQVSREAQAMAKLAHPNVVAVYDAATDGDQSFVAMELVDGSDLEVWLREPRTWRAIVARFIEAGRGLAAAHAAGIVHRDFKPANVLVGSDGRTRVTDFGLAVALEDASERKIPRGTPAYMSSEVKAGGSADARSDQYSFALALCEAVTGERALSAKLPRRLRAPIACALSEAPAERHPSMDTLVAALERALRPRRAWLAIPLVAGALAVGVVAMRDGDAASCAVPSDRFAGIWDVKAKTTIHDAFAKSGHPLAEDAWRSVEGSLDKFVQTWSASYTAACEATQRKEQSAELLDRRMACLAAQRARVATLSTMFATADRNIVGRAANAADVSERIALCNDLTLLRAASQVAPAMRARADAANVQLARVEAQSLRGKHAEAIEGARAVLAEAIATGDTRLEADATRSMGETQWRSGEYQLAIQTLYAAVDAAKRAQAPDLEGGAMLVLVAVLGGEEARFAEALQVSRLAESTIRAAGDDPRLAKLLGNRGAIHYLKADYAAARADYEQALALFERVYGPNDRRVGQTLMNLAMVIAEGEDTPVQSLVLYGKALAILEKALGPRHLEVANVLANRAIPLANAGKHADGLRDLERALAIRTEILGASHRDVAGAYLLMGEIAEDGKLPVAHVHYRTAYEQMKKLLREDHPQLASAIRGIGRGHLAAKAWPEAIDAFEQALAIWAKHGIEGAQQAETRLQLAQALWDSGRDRKRAIELATAAHAAYAKMPGQTEATKEAAAWLAAHK